MAIRPRPPTAAAAATTYFLHIPKTGGTALRHMLERRIDRRDEWRVYGPENAEVARAADRSTIERYRLVVGHFRVGVWLAHPDLAMTTMLRDPVDRVASYHRHSQMWGEVRPDAPVPSLAAYAGDGSDRRLNNQQTYLLSSRDVPTERADLRANPPYGGLTTDDLDEAVGYLGRPNVLAGLTEHFEHSVALLSVMLDIAPPPVVTANVSVGAGEEIDDRTRAVVAEHNALDVELYRAAEELFWEKWRSAGHDADVALDRLRRTSNWLPQVRERNLDRLRRLQQSTRRWTGPLRRRA